ncbi:MAG TPA: DUF4126 domain-containing protein [Armatimonadota bacterium]|nr:DUF4126 domain-containing protein [Armatimonadota bacterium]
MELLIQFMMGVSLAACAGLRAWLPLLVVGLLARTGQIDLGQSFSFLASNPALIIFGLATILELLADKIIALDNILDAIGTIMRPVAGALIATGLISFDMDPTLSTIIGIITGGGTALGLHTGKAAIRAKSTALGMFHGGIGNTVLSVIEDIFTIAVIALAILAPIIAFILTVAVVVLAVVLTVRIARSGLKVFGRFRRTPRPTNQS